MAIYFASISSSTRNSHLIGGDVDTFSVHIKMFNNSTIMVVSKENHPQIALFQVSEGHYFHGVY